MAEGAIRIAAVLCREEDLCSPHVREALCHPDGDVMTVLQLVWMAEAILKEHNIREIHWLTKHAAAKQSLERVGLQPKGVMHIIQNIEQTKEGLTQSDLPRGTRRSPTDKYYGTLLVHALWEGFHMQVMLKSFTGQYVSPTYGGEWSISKTTLQYSPLVLLPLKKTIIVATLSYNGSHQYRQSGWSRGIRGFRRTGREDNDCRQVYRRIVACPILRDMINEARLYPGGRVKIIEAKAVPPVTEPPKEVTIHTSTVMLHRFLITARELEIIYSLVSGDYLVSMTVTGSYANTGVIKNELSMRILKWTVKAHKQGKLNIIHKPTVQEHQAFAFVPAAEYQKDVWVRSGRAVYNRPTMEDWSIERRICSKRTVGISQQTEKLRNMQMQLAPGPGAPGVCFRSRSGISQGCLGAFRKSRL